MELIDLMPLVTEFNDVRDERLKLQRQTDRLKEQETELKLEVAAAIKLSGLKKVANVTYVLKVKAVAKDWEAIHAYIIENDAWDLMEKRLGQRACGERWDDKIEIPGVGKFPIDDLSIGKRVDA